MLDFTGFRGLEFRVLGFGFGVQGNGALPAVGYRALCSCSSCFLEFAREALLAAACLVLKSKAHWWVMWKGHIGFDQF